MPQVDREEVGDKDLELETSRTPEQRLVGWLAGLVRSRDVGALADLRRPHVYTLSRLVAGNFAREKPDAIPIFEQVAFQFVRFHAGKVEPYYGWGSMG